MFSFHFTYICLAMAQYMMAHTAHAHNSHNQVQVKQKKTVNCHICTVRIADHSMHQPSQHYRCVRTMRRACVCVCVPSVSAVMRMSSIQFDLHHWTSGYVTACRWCTPMLFIYFLFLWPIRIACAPSKCLKLTSRTAIANTSQNSATERDHEENLQTLNTSTDRW